MSLHTSCRSDISSRTMRWLVASAFVAALAIRIAMTAAFQGLSAPPNVSANPDQAEYEQLTYHLARGDGYTVNGTAPTAVRPPGFSLTLLPVYAVFGRSYTIARLYIILLSSLTCLFAAWAAYLWGGRTPAALAAWWLALYPGHFYYAMHFLSEPIYAFWLAVALAATIAGMRSGRPTVTVLAGAAWALAVLTRVELILLVPIAWGLVLFAPRAIRRSTARHLVVQTAVIAAFVAPWVARNAVVMHAPTLSTQRGCTFWGSHNEVTFTSSRFAGSWVNCSELVDATHTLRGDELQRDRLTMGYGLESTRRHAAQLPYLEVMKLWRFASPFFETTNRTVLLVMALGWIVAAPFVLLGLWSTWVRQAATRWVWGVVASPLLATLATTVIVYGSARYRDALAPLLAVFGAFGVIEVQWLLRRRRLQPRAAAA